MRIERSAALVLLIAVATSDVLTQAPSSPPVPARPTFDVVSIKRNTTNVVFSNTDWRPDGGFRMVNIVVSKLIERAYLVDIVGLPGWAMSERYDVSATVSRPSTTWEERFAMMRAMLADRFKLAVHVESHERPVYNLVLARRDGRLGPRIQPLDVDCVAQAEAERGIAPAARAGGTPPSPPQTPVLDAPACSVSVTRDGLTGDVSMDILAALLRAAAGRYVVDKTGLIGSYHVALNYDNMAALRAPAALTPSAAPSIFTAVQEQLGLKLESSRALRDTLVIDHLERPTEN